MLRTLRRDPYGRKANQRTWYAMLISLGIIFASRDRGIGQGSSRGQTHPKQSAAAQLL